MVGACATNSSGLVKKVNMNKNAEDDSLRMTEINILPIFDQQLIIGSPFEKFSQGIAYDAKNSAALARILPTSESPAFNKEAVLIFVRKDASITKKISAEEMSVAFESIASPGCEGRRISQSLPIKFGYGNIFATVGSCKSVVGKNLQEIALNIYFAGPRDFYIIVWTELQNQFFLTDLSDQKWRERLNQLLPLYVCPKEVTRKGISNCISGYMNLKKSIDGE
jgi:hypothetical protein